MKAISGVQTVRFKNEQERNITIKLGYANAKIYECTFKVRRPAPTPTPPSAPHSLPAAAWRAAQITSMPQPQPCARAPCPD